VGFDNGVDNDAIEGSNVGYLVGSTVGLTVGYFVSFCVGDIVGSCVGDSVGSCVGPAIVADIGSGVGSSVGTQNISQHTSLQHGADAARLSSSFPPRKRLFSPFSIDNIAIKIISINLIFFRLVIACIFYPVKRLCNLSMMFAL